MCVTDNAFKWIVILDNSIYLTSDEIVRLDIYVHCKLSNVTMNNDTIKLVFWISVRWTKSNEVQTNQNQIYLELVALNVLINK